MNKHTASAASLLTAVILAAIIMLAPPVAGNAQTATVAPPCQATHTVGTADTLTSVSNSYFGTNVYGRAILLATNARAGASGFQYIGTPDPLPVGANLCIPALPEVQVRRLRYEAYERSITETVLPRPSQVSNSLVKIPAGPVHVLTFTSARGLNSYKSGSDWVKFAPKDSGIWVTVIPEIQDFCKDFVKKHNADAEQLTVRLEQRLGLPPGSGYDRFLEIIVADPTNVNNIFRPCQNPSTQTASCPAGPPPADNAQHAGWFYQKYYGSFAQAQPNQYPWTALGYTFDWAIGDGAGGFVRYGASEFVIPQGAPIQVVGSTAMVDYCKP